MTRDIILAFFRVFVKVKQIGMRLGSLKHA